MKIKKLLVANRGEIAMRVFRTCKEMGIQTVAVYSDADRDMPFVCYADEAYRLGPGPSNQSYLLGDKIIEIALANKVDAIHPGYGFLSENAEFSEKVDQAGLIFVGPSPYSIRTMGSKISAKQAAAKFNVPMVPGTDKAIANIDEAKAIATQTGFPLLIKASAGGGGKGMRVVESMDELESQMQAAKNEALSGFGDDAVFIEKYVSSPKHIEIQIMGDQHGNYVHFYERECSIQRRHQKLIEEAPSSCLTPAIRAQMGQCAIDVAKACNYTGAGTVEFLVDTQLNFYFLEMNTRLQVEHCVTEMITNTDLVRLQIKVAEGDILPITQSDIPLLGHAIELRVCAEDPLNNFLPDNGKLVKYRIPKGPGVRVDDGFDEGLEIPIYYDSMIAKLIVYAPDRLRAIDKLKRSIQEFHILGIKNTLDFGSWVLNQPPFIQGEYDTKFIDTYYRPEDLTDDNSTDDEFASVLACHLFNLENQTYSYTNNSPVSFNNWKKNRMNY